MKVRKIIVSEFRSAKEAKISIFDTPLSFDTTDSNLPGRSNKQYNCTLWHVRWPIQATDRLIISAEAVAFADESGDVVSELTSEVWLELGQFAGGLTSLLL